MISFETMVGTAVGGQPYGYQSRLAAEGLPDLLSVPTGAGKTLAAVLPWLYRRRAHPDPAVRAMTPRRLVVVLPQRSLVEQTFGKVMTWLGELCEADPGGGWESVGAHLLLGGASSDDREWKANPTRDAVFVGTQDMVLSRLLMRGYAESRAAWPMSFGLLHADTQFVFDEVQLMGPGLPTSLQLQGLREALGTAAPCRSMWMSATVDHERLTTPDFAGVGSEAGLTEDDESGPLAVRLSATRLVRQLTVPEKKYPAELASQVAAEHRAGTRTIVVMNTVDRAAGVYDALEKLSPTARVVLLHSRFRPGDRHAHMEQALADPGAAGTIVVTTQVLEAGVDISSATLVTEVAPWSSIVQRAGRCNRNGEYPEGSTVQAQLLWVRLPGKDTAPYLADDLAASEHALAGLEGRAVTSRDLLAAAAPEVRPLHPVLRRRDLVDLFDTAPDLGGNDLDVSRWIRDADERTVSVAWRDLDGKPPTDDAPALAREELCPVPVAQLREFLTAAAKGRRTTPAWVFDSPGGEWVQAGTARLRPGGMVLLDAAVGGYTERRGWAAGSPHRVAPAQVSATTEGRAGTGPWGRSSAAAPAGGDEPEDFTSDPRSASSRPVTLAEHLRQTQEAVDGLLGEYGPLPGLSPAVRAAAVRAGLFHDLGKAHEVFVASMERVGAGPEGGPWAKSGSSAPLRHEPRAFRHELVSALILTHPEVGLLNGETETELVTYLVAAHHGKVRLSVRSLPSEQEDRILGVGPSEVVHALELVGVGSVPELVLDREVLRLGGDGLSWTARACRLRDREDLGPFRLAFLEAVVRVGDWRSSAPTEVSA